MGTIAFNVTDFRAAFPAFASTSTYSDAALNAYFDQACLFVNPSTGSVITGTLSDNQKSHILSLLVAHVATIADQIAAGNTPTILNSSSIDKISVGIVPPNTDNAFRYWMNLTPYGSQALALLSVIGVGGLHVGGNAELSAFRRAGGVF